MSEGLYGDTRHGREEFKQKLAEAKGLDSYRGLYPDWPHIEAMREDVLQQLEVRRLLASSEIGKQALLEAMADNYSDEGMFRLMAAVCLNKANDTGEPQTFEWQGIEIEIKPLGTNDD